MPDAYRAQWDREDRSWRVAQRDNGEHYVTLGWMRFATEEAAQQWIDNQGCAA